MSTQYPVSRIASLPGVVVKQQTPALTSTEFDEVLTLADRIAVSDRAKTRPASLAIQLAR